MKPEIGAGLERRHLFLIALFLCALGLAAGAVFWGKGEEEPVIVETRMAGAVTEENETIFVYISGAVRTPGVYELHKGSRVYELLKAAGNQLPYADMDRVNLSETLVDGEQIHIPVNPRPLSSGLPAGTRLVNINTAGEKELETLPGVGPATAKRILDFRDAHGNFKEKQDLKQVPTIGDVKYTRLADKITL